MLRRTILLFTVMTAALLVCGGVALAASVSEVEPNDSLAEAQNLDGSFSLDFDPDITLYDESDNDDTIDIDTSQIVPHSTVNSTGNNTVDFYSFTVSQAGDTVILDVDGAYFFTHGDDDGFDSWLELYDNNGNILAQDDNAPYDPGPADAGSAMHYDSYLEYTFQTPGTYYVAVGANCFPGCTAGALHHLYPVPGGYSYKLNVSLGNNLPHLCGGQPPTIEAQSGRATKGTKGDDIIYGTEGPDTIDGAGGDDQICGRGGEDTIQGGDGNDNLWGQYGNDNLSGGPGNDLLSGGTGNDQIMGDLGDDYIRGDDGNDYLDGGQGRNSLFGGEGRADQCSVRASYRETCELVIGGKDKP